MEKSKPPALWAGNWGHLFGPGKIETQCRILIDANEGSILAAQASTGLKFEDISRAEMLDLSDSVIGANEAHLTPFLWGLDPCADWPDWAAHNKEQASA